MGPAIFVSNKLLKLKYFSRDTFKKIFLHIFLELFFFSLLSLPLRNLFDAIKCANRKSQSFQTEFGKISISVRLLIHVQNPNMRVSVS